MTGLEKILREITAAAETDCRRILTETEAECRRIAEEYAKRGIETRDAIAERSEKEGENMIARAKSTCEMNHRNILLGARAECLNRAFALAKAEIVETDFGKYKALLSALLVCALSDIKEIEDAARTLGDEVEDYAKIEVIFNRKDREAFGASVVNEAKRTAERRVGAEYASKLVLAEDTATIDGGLVLRCGNIETNCSIRVLLEEIRKETEAEVSAILFGEKAV